MNRREELLRYLRQRPFQPFRIHLTAGRVLDVRYPDMNIVLNRFAMIGIPEPSVPDPFAERTELVEFSLIRQVESLPAAAAQAFG